jgi:Mg2+ and Co2+ transporter CorA
MMTTAQYLRQIENYDNRIKNKLIEEEQLSSLSTSVSAIPVGEKVQTSVKRDPMGDMVAKIFDLREEISKMISEFLQKRQEIVRTIEQVEDPLLYLLRYCFVGLALLPQSAYYCRYHPLQPGSLIDSVQRSSVQHPTGSHFRYL